MSAVLTIYCSRTLDAQNHLLIKDGKKIPLVPMESRLLNGRLWF